MQPPEELCHGTPRASRRSPRTAVIRLAQAIAGFDRSLLEKQSSSHRTTPPRSPLPPSATVHSAKPEDNRAPVAYPGSWPCKSFRSLADGAASGRNELFSFNPGKCSVLVQKRQRLRRKPKPASQNFGADRRFPRE